MIWYPSLRGNDVVLLGWADIFRLIWRGEIKFSACEVKLKHAWNI